MSSAFRTAHPSTHLVFRLSAVLGLLLISALASAQVDSHGTGATIAGLDVERKVETIEEVCIHNLRAINGAQAFYWGGDAKKGYARTLQQLGPKAGGVLEAELASGRKSFYRLKLIPEPTDSSKPVVHYVLLARPINRITKEQKSFYTDDSGVIRFTTQNRVATIADLPID